MNGWATICRPMGLQPWANQDTPLHRASLQDDMLQVALMGRVTIGTRRQGASDPSLSGCARVDGVIRSAVPRLRQIIALLLLVLWTPVVSHCLLEVALGVEEAGCCESGGPSEPDHHDCATCLSVESGQAKTDTAKVPAPRLLDLAEEIPHLAFSSASETGQGPPVIRQPDDTPPVPPAAVILQATIAQPVRGPSLAI